MNKEKIFEEMKALILVVKDEGDKLTNDVAFKKQWQERESKLVNAMENIDSCEALWLNEKYGEWYAKEIEPLANNFKL